MTGAHAPSRRLPIRFGIPAAVLVGSAFYAGVPNDSAACSCACWGTPEEELAEWDLVFRGRMIDSHKTIGCGRKDEILAFEVLDGYRGARTGDRVELFVNAADQCGAAGMYVVGDELVIFTNTENPWLSDCNPRAEANGRWDTCMYEEWEGSPEPTFDEVVAALEAATD